MAELTDENKEAIKKAIADIDVWMGKLHDAEFELINIAERIGAVDPVAIAEHKAEANDLGDAEHRTLEASEHAMVSWYDLEAAKKSLGKMLGGGGSLGKEGDD